MVPEWQTWQLSDDDAHSDTQDGKLDEHGQDSELLDITVKTLDIATFEDL